MKHALAALVVFALFTTTAFAQEMVATSSTQGDKTVDDLLKRYELAYKHRSIDELLAIWPTLKSDRKLFSRTKDDFASANISDLDVSVQMKETQNLPNGDLLIHCARTEQYTKLETASYSSGDNMMGATPVQNPGPKNLTEKRSIRRTGEIWVTLHNSGTSWVIASLNDKKPR